MKKSARKIDVLVTIPVEEAITIATLLEVLLSLLVAQSLWSFGRVMKKL